MESNRSNSNEGLSRDSIDAIRHCVRILSPLYDSETRQQMVLNAESFIAQGTWIPAFTIEQIPILFFPHDKQRAADMLAKMRAATDSGELPFRRKRFERDGIKTFLASDLAAWVNCPNVPENSPLKYWLPSWMLATEEDEGVAIVDHREAITETGVTRNDIINAFIIFDDLDKNGRWWENVLESYPSWLKEHGALIVRGKAGVLHRWNPARIAYAIRVRSDWRGGVEPPTKADIERAMKNFPDYQPEWSQLIAQDEEF